MISHDALTFPIRHCTGGISKLFMNQSCTVGHVTVFHSTWRVLSLNILEDLWHTHACMLPQHIHTCTHTTSCMHSDTHTRLHTCKDTIIHKFRYTDCYRTVCAYNCNVVESARSEVEMKIILWQLLSENEMHINLCQQLLSYWFIGPIICFTPPYSLSVSEWTNLYVPGFYGARTNPPRQRRSKHR